MLRLPIPFIAFSPRTGLTMTITVSEMPSAFDPITDGALVDEALGGNRSAFDELVRRYQRRATAVAYRLLGNLQDALEIAQEAFLKAFTNLSSLHSADAFGAWLLRIVSNLSLNYRRIRTSRHALSVDDVSQSVVSHDAQPSRVLQSGELADRIYDALNQLPERQRTAIVSFALEQLPQKEIAQSLGCSTQAVKWHVFDARRKLKSLLSEYL
jgi:RNA polymerase sigma-70 factor, ECF subfamily